MAKWRAKPKIDLKKAYSTKQFVNKKTEFNPQDDVFLKIHDPLPFHSRLQIDFDVVDQLSKTYGEIDGYLSYKYAANFTWLGQTLTNQQKWKQWPA